MKKDAFVLGGKEFTSRFILGSGKYSVELIKAAVENAGAEIVTLAVRRTNTKKGESILDYIPPHVTLLPNTSGARNAEEAVRIARMAREIGCGDFIKVEIMKDSKYLLPDNPARRSESSGCVQPPWQWSYPIFQIPWPHTSLACAWRTFRCKAIHPVSYSPVLTTVILHDIRGRSPATCCAASHICILCLPCSPDSRLCDGLRLQEAVNFRMFEKKALLDQFPDTCPQASLPLPAPPHSSALGASWQNSIRAR